ncbi:probable serine/threonine-protein kinase kinX [Periophthalmus magnuspinnatus]|uniref:probable serine/threonine-protein kinase kinX n=1 Tax=Periophthalmus magnuspinnatus TaxID=409849 RepID=UPI00243744BD|nr:probable serine/threonine-protein kinase kinX [Periophthalmus magnuspinnatus]
MDPSISMANSQNPEFQDDLEKPVRIERGESIASAELSQEITQTTPHSSTDTAQYYCIMEDECPHHLTSPPSLPSRLEPEGGSTCEAAAADPSVSLRSSDGTEANTNPECLDWHHGEKQLMTSHNQVNEEMESVLPTFEEVVSSDYSSGIQCTTQNQELLEDRFKTQEWGESTERAVEECNDDGVPKDQMLDDQDQELKLVEVTNLLDDTGLNYPHQRIERFDLASIATQDNPNTMEVTSTQSPDNSHKEGMNSQLEDALDNDLREYDWVRGIGVEDDEEDRGLDEQEDSDGTASERRLATEILQGKNLLQRLQLIQQNQDSEDICSQTPKPEVDMITNVASEAIQQEEQSEEEPQTESPLLTMTAQLEDCSIHETDIVHCNIESDNRCFVVVKETSADEDLSKQFEQNVPESHSTKTQVVGILQMTKECCLEDRYFMGEERVDEEDICTEEKTNSNEGDELEEKGRTSLLTLSPQQTDNREASDRNADYINGTWKFKDENRTPFPPCHRLSAAETFTEKQFQKSSQMKQDLQRAEGVSDLTENPDILEIPFKSNICLEPLPTRADCAPTEEWHFSEQKMQKEIRQDMQREMVLVNLGKIPGGYSKGESRQMKDTKLLFEAFQQVKIEGPTRIRKNMGSLPKRPLYPSVLERTHSLEMFSQKTSPMLRTHSFHLVSASEKEKYPETFRPLSPCIRDKPRLSPYPKHEKHTRMHKSMDSINRNSPTSTGGRSSKQEPAREGSPLLKENPFFKLRPALSLQPEVEKDIREAKKREEELRKQRSSLYGDMMQGSRDDGRSTAELKADPMQKTTGRLDRVWPPPSKKEHTKAEQQEVKVQRGPGHKTSLWQRWESGFINRQSSTNNN